MAEPCAFRRGHRGERTELVEHCGFEFGGRHLHGPPAKALQVGEGGVGTEAGAAVTRRAHGVAHHQRVAGMEAAGDVGRIDDRQQRLIVAHLPGAEGFAQIGVQIELHAWLSVSLVTRASVG